MKAKYLFVAKSLCIVLCAIALSSCTGVHRKQMLVEDAILENDYARATELLSKPHLSYGKNNQILYLFDKGYAEHLAKEFTQSILTLAQAKRVIDELYTKSLSKIAATWIFNDYSADYRAEDFEQIHVNVFQALNYAAVGDYPNALVEIRDADSRLGAIAAQYSQDYDNRYQDDAFVRFLSGILYEASATPQDLNDAFIAYRNAYNAYVTTYSKNYGLTAPEILKENLLATAQIMGKDELRRYQEEFSGIKTVSLREKRDYAEVYLIHYNGTLPIKVEEYVYLPMPEGYMIKVAIPQYSPRPYSIYNSQLVATDIGGREFSAMTEKAQDLGKIAVESLQNKKVWLIAKSTVRASGRYTVEKKQEENIEKKKDSLTAKWFRFFSNIFNIFIEQADRRCWQTLPDQIRISRLLLPPGEYKFAVNAFNQKETNLGSFDLGEETVAAGKKRFFFIHTAY